jgi:hypothetical protein
MISGIVSLSCLNVEIMMIIDITVYVASLQQLVGRQKNNTHQCSTDEQTMPEIHHPL